MNRLSLILLLFIFGFVFPYAAHAYAGPGVAIGAIIVFLTVVAAFFASTFITIISFIKKIFGFKSKKNKSHQKKDKKSQVVK